MIFCIWIGEELNHRENWRFFTPNIRGFPADCPFNSGSFASGTGTSSNMEDHHNHDIIICETLFYFKSIIILKFRITTIWNRCSGKNAVLPHVILQLLHTFTVFFHMYEGQTPVSLVLRNATSHKSPSCMCCGQIVKNHSISFLQIHPNPEIYI